MEKQKRYNQLLIWAEKHRSLMLEVERFLWNHPETGYQEWETHAYLKSKFEALGYAVTQAEDIPGFFTDIDTGIPGPKLLILAELDALIVESHPECNPKTGAVHACGHNVQCAALLGVAAALKEPNALHGISGSIRLMAVPAEECIEMDFRDTLRKQGVIRYHNGKAEFMYRGYMDDVDLAFMVHTASSLPNDLLYHIDDGANGCIIKTIEFQGVSAHSASRPHQGVNALYMATSALQTVNALRESFREEEHIRFATIITQGGSSANAIPDNVMLEGAVRGSTLGAVVEQNKKINRALAASAAAFGGNVVLKDRPGYSPLENSKEMAQQTLAAVTDGMGEGAIAAGGWVAACTDMGELSQVMPVLHPYCAGASGITHGNNFQISNPEQAVVGSCKLQLLMLEALLGNHAIGAKESIKKAKPVFATKKDYFAAIDNIFMEKQAVNYQKDGTVILDF